MASYFASGKVITQRFVMLVSHTKNVFFRAIRGGSLLFRKTRLCLTSMEIFTSDSVHSGLELEV